MLSFLDELPAKTLLDIPNERNLDGVGRDASFLY